MKKTQDYKLDMSDVSKCFARTKRKVNAANILIIGDKEEVTVFLLHLLPLNEQVRVSTFKVFVLQHRVVFLGVERALQVSVMTKADLYEERMRNYDFVVMCFNFGVEESYCKFENWNNFLDEHLPNDTRILLGCGCESYDLKLRNEILLSCEKQNIEYWPFPSSFLNIIPHLVQRIFRHKLSEVIDWRDEKYPPLESLFPHLWIFEESVSSIHDLVSNLVREISVDGESIIIQTWSRAVLRKLQEEKISRKDVLKGFNLLQLCSVSFSWLYDYRLRGTENSELVGEILRQMFGLIVKVYFIHVKPTPDLVYLFDNYIFWIPHSKYSFSTIICNLWKEYLITQNTEKSKKKRISSIAYSIEIASTIDTEHITNFSENLEILSDEVFELLLKSFFFEQKLRLGKCYCGEESRSSISMMELLKMLVDIVFGNYNRDLNIRIPKFLCQMFQYEGSLSSIGFDIVLYYYTKVKTFSEVHNLLEFLRVIIHHPFFIEYSKSKRHCLSEIIMELIQKYIIEINFSIISKNQISSTSSSLSTSSSSSSSSSSVNSSVNSSANSPEVTHEKLVQFILSLFHDHISLGMLNYEKEKLILEKKSNETIKEIEDEEEKKNEEINLIAITFFPFVKKLFMKMDGLNIKLKYSEELKLGEIILCIFRNIPKTSLIEWFVSKSSVIGMNYWTEFLLRIFCNASKKFENEKRKNQKNIYFDYCITVLETYKLYIENIQSDDDIFFRIMRLTFQLPPLLFSKGLKELFCYFVEFEFMNILNGLKRHCFGFDNRWRFIVNHVLNTLNTRVFSEIGFSEKVNLLMLEVLKDLLRRYAITLDRRQPIKAFSYEKEIIGKNILLNETLEHTLKAASLNKLVEFIIKSRSAMTEVFLTTHQLFVPTIELLNIIITYYHHNRKNLVILGNTFYLLKLFIQKFFFFFGNLEIAYLLIILYRIKIKGVKHKFPKLQKSHSQSLKTIVMTCLSQTHDRIQPFDDEDEDELDSDFLENRIDSQANGNTSSDSFSSDGECESEEDDSVFSSDEDERKKTSKLTFSKIRKKKDSLKYNWKMLSHSAEESYRKSVNLKNLWYVEKYEPIIPPKFKGKLEKVERSSQRAKTWEDLNDFIFKWDCKEIARQWVLLDFELFKRIPSLELVFRLHPQLGKSPTLAKLEARSKANILWIENAIIREKNPKKRLEVAKKFVDILRFLNQFNNFVGIDSIVSAMEATPIERLLSPHLNIKDSKNIMLLSHSEFGVIHSNSQILQQNHGESLIISLDSVDVAIPAWKIYHNRLIHIEKINPESYKLEYEGNEVNLINLNKQRLIYNILTQIKRFQNQDMFQTKISKIPALHTALKRIASMSSSFLGKKEIYEKSLEYKPKNITSVRFSRNFFE